jgi:hypothetical protein
LCDKVVMEQLQAEFTALTEQITKQGDDTSSSLMAFRDSLKAMANTSGQVVENIKGLNKWAPNIENSIQYLHKSLEEVGMRVATFWKMSAPPLKIPNLGQMGTASHQQLRAQCTLPTKAWYLP